MAGAFLTSTYPRNDIAGDIVGKLKSEWVQPVKLIDVPLLIESYLYACIDAAENQRNGFMKMIGVEAIPSMVASVNYINAKISALKHAAENAKDYKSWIRNYERKLAKQRYGGACHRGTRKRIGCTPQS